MDRNKVVKILFGVFFGVGVLLLLVMAGLLLGRVDKTGISTCVLGIMAGVWLAVGGIGLYVIGRGQKRRARLIESGRRVQASITGVSRDTMYQVNGAHPWRIECQYIDEGEKTIYVFRSDPIWFDPTPLLAGKQAVEVCVDGYDYSKYTVDIDGITGGYRVKNV